MASVEGGPTISFTLADAREEDAADAELEAPDMSSEDSEGIVVSCRWKTSEFYDQECYHYFDCPSHLVARILSVGEAQEPNVPRGGLSTRPEANNDTPSRESLDETRSLDLGFTMNELQQGDETVDTEVARSVAALDVNDAAGPSRFDPVVPIRAPSMTDHTRILLQQGNANQMRSNDDNIVRQFWDNEEFVVSGSSRDFGSNSLETSSWGQTSVESSRSAGEGSSHQPPIDPPDNEPVESTEVVLPRWQPDAEVTYCPICQTQFSIFVRKHHCRKCGRVVCNSCSPHRIIIPHQFIVRPPGSEVPLPQSLLVDGLSALYVDVNGPSGGERVRLCNPCVPDPNTAPPQSPTSPDASSPRSTRRRTRSSLGGGYPAAAPVNRYSGVFAAGQSNDPYQFYTSRSRSITMDPTQQRAGGGPSSRRRSSATYQAYQASLDRLLAVGPSSLSSAAVHHHHHHHHSSRRRLAGESSSSSARYRALPPPPQIAEEDECPICHLELPSRELPNFEALRESHIASCIQAHSTYGSPRTASGDDAPVAAPRRTGMYTYPATEKDCIDDAECTICLEEFTVGVPMARLECLCRFHRACIAAWFVNHPGRCPVHQHDGFGY